MGQWTKQMGFPLLTLKDYTPNPKDGTVALSLEQSWFLADGSTPEPDLVDGSEKMWMVPIFAQASGGDVRPGGRPIGRPPEAGEADASPEEMSLMPAAKSYSMSVKGDGQWVKLNAGQHVPLRVKYPDSMIPALCEAVKAKAVGAADRIGILSDQAALTKAGLLDPALYLQVLAAYAAEDDATVWGMVLEQLAGLHALLVGGGAPELLGLFDTFARSLLLPKLAELGWTPRDSDGHLTRKLRGELICVLPNFCATDAAVVGEARRRFDAFVAAPEGDGAKELPAEYQEAVYKLVLKNGGEKEFDQILSLFDSLTLNTARKAALQGLGAAPTDALRTRALEFAIGGKVKLQDLFYVAISMHTSGEVRWGAPRTADGPDTHPARPATGRAQCDVGVLQGEPAEVHRAVRQGVGVADGRRHLRRVPLVRHRREGGGGEGLLRGADAAEERADDRAAHREYRDERQVRRRRPRLQSQGVARGARLSGWALSVWMDGRSALSERRPAEEESERPPKGRGAQYL